MSNTIEIPDFNVAPVNAINPAPKPHAAPEPGMFKTSTFKSFSITLEKEYRDSSRNFTCSSFAPF